MELNLGSISIPVSAAVRTMGVIGKKGSGKTFYSAVLAEEFHRVGVPFVVFDPIDVWWGLRLSADGKKPGLPVVVFGVEHADIQLTRDMGVEIARAVVRDNVSCVISTFGMTKADQRKLIMDFSEELMRINDRPRHIFIEEAPEFLPQRVWGGLAQAFAAVEALVRMGRNRSIGVTLISQRAATIHKDVLTQIDTLIALRLLGPQDRAALGEWVEAHSAQANFDKFMKTLPSLPTGQAWVWSPEFLEIFKLAKIRKRNTFHPDPEKRGQFSLDGHITTDVMGFIERFTAAAAAAKPVGVVKSVKKDKRGGMSVAVQPVVPKEDLHFANEEIRRLKSEHESQMVAKDVLIGQANDRAQRAENKLRQIASIAGVAPDAGGGGDDVLPGLPETNLMLEKLGGMPRKIYETLLKHPNGLTSKQIGLMCGYAPSSGSFRNARAKLKTMGLVNYQGDVVKVVLR